VFLTYAAVFVKITKVPIPRSGGFHPGFQPPVKPGPRRMQITSIFVFLIEKPLTMRNFLFILAAFLILKCGNENSSSQKATKYPVTRKVDSADTYFGVKVADPYRWLEDDNSDSTKKWVDQQNEVTQAYLAGIPYRGKIRERLRQVWNY
jgi:hypothetical protein